MKIDFKAVLFYTMYLSAIVMLPSFVFADSKGELKEISKQIKAEEAELSKLRGEKANIGKRLALISSKIDNNKRLVNIADKDIKKANARLKEIKEAIVRAKANIEKIKQDVAKSNIFVIDNLGYTYMKIISTSKNPGSTIMTLEILSKAGNSLDGKVEELNLVAEELRQLTAEQTQRLETLALVKAERQEALNNLEAGSKEYKTTLVLLKHDEAGRLEYLDMLEFRRNDLDNRIKEAARRAAENAVISGNSVFEKSKGSLPMPITGKVIELFGNRLVKEAGVTFFHKGWKIQPQVTSEVLSVAGGTVVFADYMKGFENLVIVSHGGAYYTVYGNLSDVNIEQGKTIRAGDVLGMVRVTDIAEGHHLYFEIRKNDQALDPGKWLVAYGRR